MPGWRMPIRIHFARRWRSLASGCVVHPEEFKAWSQNLGHEQVLTTFSSYGQVAQDRQAELIRGLGRIDSHTLQGEAMDEMMRFLENARHPPH